MEIEIIRGDITTVEVDAIVTAANSGLVGGGGVDGAVHRAAGPRLLAALRPLAPCPAGGAVITPAFNLGPRIMHVIHAVGPRYGIDEPSDELLASAYLASLARGDEVGAASIAFPAISSGAYGYPLREACHISVTALRAAFTSIQLCLLVAFNDEIRDGWESALDV
ncbi:MAG: macro domain-containing protein [bacterium]|nr:macro domain-containing protein [bacterium]